MVQHQSKQSLFLRVLNVLTNQCMDNFDHFTITLGAAKRVDTWKRKCHSVGVVETGVHVWHTVQPVLAWKVDVKLINDDDDDDDDDAIHIEWLLKSRLK